MKKNKLIYVLVTSIALTLTASLSSCANGENVKWAYTKEDMSEFIKMEAFQTNNSDGTITFSADTNIEIFDGNINNDDVIAFNQEKVEEELKNSGKTYADYSVLKKASLDVVKINNLSDKDGFDITFKGEDTSSNYGMLLYSSVTKANKFVLVSKYEEEEEIEVDPQASYEESYISKIFTWGTGVKLITSIFTNFCTGGMGGIVGNPVAFTSGVMGIFSSLMESITSNDSTIKNVLDKLKDIDKKVDDISKKIDKNSQMLQDEIVRTNANVDKANLNILNVSINEFATNAISPIAKFNRLLEDELGNYYRKIISDPQSIKLELEKDTEFEYYSVPLHEINDNSKYNFEFNIDDFTNAKAFLKENDDIVKSGFVGELEKDIENALNKSINLNSEIKIEDYVKFISSRIYESFIKEYFSTNRSEAQEYRELMIDLAERISGMNGKLSYLDTYLSRLQYMYNFQNEIKPLLRTFCASLLKILDTNTALATEACYYAKYNYEELSNVYKTTRENIQKFYKTNKDLDNSYSFITGTNLTGTFYSCKYEVSYTELGNHPTLHTRFVAYDYEKKENISAVEYGEINLSRHQGISEASHLKMATRWNILKSLDVASSTVDYIHYLASNDAIKSEGIGAADLLLDWKDYNKSCYRILTSVRDERELNSSDSNIVFNCVAKGNPDSEYFRIGEKYNFQGSRDGSCWAGKTFEGKFIDATYGTSLGTQKMASYARYAEDHWYWTTDEFFAFTNDTSNNYFFIIESK